jgi:Putative papain-like cysteine peptidase (DUF1796)
MAAIGHLSEIIDVHGYPAHYNNVKAKEDALRLYREYSGDSSQVALELALAANSRLAYLEALRILEDGLRDWPEMSDPFLGISGRNFAIDCAVHGNDYVAANKLVSELGEKTEVITSANALSVCSSVRGVGIHSAVPSILDKCLSSLPRNAPGRNVIESLLDDYEETSELAEKVSLISLGAGCYGWLQLNRYLLRKVDAVSNSMPFNMSANTIENACRMMEDDFNQSSSPHSYSAAPSVQGIPMPRSIPYGFLYNHECDNIYFENDFERLRDLNRGRAASFRNYGCSGPRVYVLVTSWAVDIPRLERALAAYMQDDQYRLLLISTQFDAPTDWVRGCPNTRIAHVPVPHEGYTWTSGQSTQAGYDFDFAVRTIVRKTMLEIAAA